MPNFAENLRRYRKNHKLTQVALGEKINSGYTKISMLESGRCEPDSDTAKALAEILKVTIEDLFGNSN